MTKGGDPVRLLLNFSAPLFLSNLLQQFYNLTDTALAGHILGTLPWRKSGATAALYGLIMNFAFGMNNGLALTVSRLFGAGDERGVRRATAWMLALAGATAAVLTVVFVGVRRPLLVLLQVPEASIDGALAYMTLILLGIPLTMAYNMEAALLRAIGNSLTPLYFLRFSTVLNIGLDIAFMGPLQLGVGGAAAATVVAQGISAVLCGWYIIRNYPALHFTRNAFANGKKFAANMFWAGLSMGLMSAIYNIGSVVLQSSINALGSTYIAAQVAPAALRNCSSSAVRWASQWPPTAARTWVGHRSRIMKGVTTALGIYFVWWVFVMLFVFFLSDPAVRAITGTNDEVISSNAVLYLKISAPVIPPMAVLVIVRNMLQGIQHTIEPLLASGLELIGKVIFGVWIVPAVGYTAVCFCEPVTWVICFVFILGALYRCRGELKDKE